MLVEPGHQGGGRRVVDFPEAGHDSAATGQVEGPLQSEDTFTAGSASQPGLASGEYRQLAAGEIE